MSWLFSAWHRLAVTRFALAPSEFWSMPLSDWLALMAPTQAAMEGAALTQLMKDYPDD